MNNLISKYVLFLLAAATFCNQPCEAQSSQGDWVWADAGWATSVSGSPTPSNSKENGTGTIVTAGNSGTGKVDVFAMADTSYRLANASGTAVLAKKRKFYWKSPCSAPCPAPPTLKTVTANVEATANTTATASPGAVANDKNYSNAILSFTGILSYSDDYVGNGDLANGQILYTDRFVAKTFPLIDPADPDADRSGVIGGPYVLQSSLKCSASFAVRYEWTGSAFATLDHWGVDTYRATVTGRMDVSGPY